jgi:hypothetical protein
MVFREAYQNAGSMEGIYEIKDLHGHPSFGQPEG